MGLDMYIDARRNIGTPLEERQEKVYWRKFWDLQDEIIRITDADTDSDSCCISDTRITDKDLDAIIDFCCRNRDYFDSYNSVLTLCELREELPQLKEQGWTLWYNSNW